MVTPCWQFSRIILWLQQLPDAMWGHFLNYLNAGRQRKEDKEERGGGGAGETTDLKAKAKEVMQQGKVWRRHRVYAPSTFFKVGIQPTGGGCWLPATSSVFLRVPCVFLDHELMPSHFLSKWLPEHISPGIGLAPQSQMLCIIQEDASLR